ncbi:MAG TPA: PPOX class F420-dependent oxidoreductase [Actinomycetota bacterium]|jgi:PPOX class probable F420-dependent enzyme
MDLELAGSFIQQNHRAVLATRRRDGSPHLTLVTCGLDGVGRAIISSTEDRVKVKNLRRDPRASLCVMPDRFFGGGVQVYGSATIVSLPDAMEPLIDYFRRVAGKEHPTGMSTDGQWRASAGS